MLSGPEIARQIREGAITIDPYDPKRLNPNSYNLRLGPTLGRYYSDPILDMAKENPFFTFAIPPEGFVLQPGVLYLGTTVERVCAKGFAPKIDGRSSVARLGIFTHVTAGFGDDGFDGAYTLEIVVVHPVRVYAGVDICQIAFTKIEGQRRPYKGKYQGQTDPTPSKLWKDFLPRD